ncbi:DUF6048 family protein [Frigoriflavimonas asaccharolytica]|nr:DUF6048 family protein [Frigoriflavimonas asaccharolytica]
MKQKHIFFLFFSLFFVNSFSQEKMKKVSKEKYEPNFIIGFDVVNAGISFSSDRKVYQGFVSSKIKKDLHAIIDAGFEKNIYQKNGYNAKVSGPYLKVGAFYMLIKDPENEFNGFYAGGKLAGSYYLQEYFAIPVRGFNGDSSSVAFPSSNQTAIWVEGNLGGRIQLFSSNFYIDLNVQPKYLAFATKQEDVDPVIIPGFGRSSGKFNMGFAWNLAYKF